MKALADWQARVLEGVRRNADVRGLFLEPIGDRFGVYSEGYWLSVSASLVEDFPLTERLLGAARFEEAMRTFLALERDEWNLELGEVSLAFAAWLTKGVSAGGRRSLALDLTALSSRRALEPEKESGIGLHPSARFFREGMRGYVFWRAEGEVCRERIDQRTERLLRVFTEPALIEALGERLGSLGEEPAFVQDAVAAWTEAGLICVYSPREE